MYCLGTMAMARKRPETTLKEPAKKKRKLPPTDWHGFEFDADLPVDQFLRDISKCPMFSLRPITSVTDDDLQQEYLACFFDPSLETADVSGMSKYRLLQRFFRLPSQNISEASPEPNTDDNIDVEPDANESQISDDRIRSLYEQLREAHSNGSQLVATISKDRPPDGLIPTLWSYQQDAVNWMLMRERQQLHFPSEFVEITLRDSSTSGSRFYFNPRTLVVSDRWPGDLAIPSGGILADEMGLGKTVEMLALILANRRPMNEDGGCSGHESRIGK